MFEGMLGGLLGGAAPTGPGGGPWMPWQPLPGGAPAMPAAPPPGPDATDWLGGGVPNPAGDFPGAFALEMAKRGIGPGQVLPAVSGGGGGLGAALNPAAPGVGGEVAREAEAATLPPTAAPASGMAPTGATRNPFSGLSMPTPPTAQRVDTPAAPRPSSQIKTGELLALMQALGSGGYQPTGLASAIGRL